MACNVSGNQNGTDVRSWLDLVQLVPRDPSSIIEWARLDTVVGQLKASTTFINPAGGTWIGDNTALSGNPSCSTLETTNALRVAEAEQWNFLHLTRNSGPVAPPLEKLIFLRAGCAWKMSIPFTNPNPALDIQLSFRNNAGTRGDAQGTVPVIEFAGGFESGAHTLELVLRIPAHVVMGLRFNIDGGQYSMYESEWVIVP